MANNKVLRLDITKTPDLVPTIYGRVADGLVQTVDVYVTNNGEPFDVTGWTIKFEGNTSGNRTFIADSENVKIVNAKGGFFQYTFPLPAFANSGKYERAYFSFALNEKHESSNNFNIQVFENADITVEEAHTVITEYEKLVDELNKIFIEAQEDLTNDVEEYKQWLTQQVQELQNKIDILNSNYDKANAKLVDLESRMNDLVNNGLLKMEDVLSFLGGKNVQIKVPIDFTGKISGSTVENPNVMKFNSFLAENINAEATVTAGGELISDDVEVTMWKNYKHVSALDGKLAQAQQATNGLVTYHLARIDAVSEISRRFPNLFINVGATTPAQQKEQLIKKATLVSATAYGFGLIGDAYKYTIGRSNWTTTGTTWQGWTGWNGENNSHSSSKPDPVTVSVGSVDTIMDQNGIMSFIIGVPIPSDGTKTLRTNLDYFVCEITLNLNINDLIPKPDLSKYYTKTETDQKDTVLDTKINGVQTNLNNAKTDLENKIEQTYNAQPLPSGVTSLSALSDYSGKTFYITKSQMDSLTDNSDLPAEIVGSYNYIVENSESRAGTYRQQFVYTTSVSKRDRYSRVILNGGSKTPFERIITEHRYGILEFKDTVVNVQDWDTLTSTGVYTVYNASGANKPPGGLYGTLVVLADNVTVTQEYTSGGKRFIRTRAGSPAVWKDWAELVSKAMMDSELKLRDNEIESLKNKKVRWEGWFDTGNMVNPIRDKSRLGWGSLAYTREQVDGIPMDENPFELSLLYFKAKRDVTFYIEGTIRAQGNYTSDTSRYAYWHLRVNTDQGETTGAATHVASTNEQNNGALQWKNFSSFAKIISMKAGESMAMSVDLESGKTLLQADLRDVHVKCLN